MLLTRTPTVALLGNPNTGKTTLFNALAGMNQRVGNYPGVTVETKKGKFRFHDQVFEVIDLPGTYSLAPRSPDEMVAVDLILGHKDPEHRPDVVVAIVDASNLERNLYLMTQAAELGVPLVIALNMTDIAKGQGIDIDAGQLSCKLGIPVVPIQANRGKGLDDLKKAIAQSLRDVPSPPYGERGRGEGPTPPCGPSFPEAFEDEVNGLRAHLSNGAETFIVRRLLLDVGGYTEQLFTQKHGAALTQKVHDARQRLAQANCAVPAVEARIRYAWIRQALTGCVQRPDRRHVTWTDRIDRVLTHKIWGTLIFLGVMLLMFQSIFTWAGPLMDLMDAGAAKVADLAGAALDPGPLRSLVVDGIIGGVGSVIIFLPQILILFAFIAILEDCGYMARAAFLMDKLMARAGLNGRSFIPLLSSVACAVPGIMAARVIENRRDRFATILVAPLMSCSARLPVYMLLIAAFLTEGYAWWVPGVTLFAMYCVGMVVAPAMAFLFKSTLLRGETPVFVMEMPLYKVPSVRQIVRRSVESGWMFLRRAGTLILASMIVVWALLYFPTTDVQGNSYPEAIAALQEKIDRLDVDKDQPGNQEKIDKLQQELNLTYREWKGHSWLGRMGKAIEPAVRPLGWDWRIGMAALASFPAREVFVGSMGIIFGKGEVDAGADEELKTFGQSLHDEMWEDEPSRPIYNVPVALSIMVFFALCCQCVSTLAIIKRETNSWRWPIFTFTYMTVLAYLGALVVYQIAVRC